MPPAPAVCSDPAPAVYRVGEVVDRKLVNKVADERDGYRYRLRGCRESWNAMAARYRGAR